MSHCVSIDALMPLQVVIAQEVRSKLGALLEVTQDSIEVAIQPRSGQVSPVASRSAANTPPLLNTDSLELSAIVAPPVGCSAQALCGHLHDSAAHSAALH